MLQDGGSRIHPEEGLVSIRRSVHEHVVTVVGTTSSAEAEA